MYHKAFVTLGNLFSLFSPALSSVSSFSNRLCFLEFCFPSATPTLIRYSPCRLWSIITLTLMATAGTGGILLMLALATSGRNRLIAGDRRAGRRGWGGSKGGWALGHQWRLRLRLAVAVLAATLAARPTVIGIEGRGANGTDGVDGGGADSRGGRACACGCIAFLVLIVGFAAVAAITATAAAVVIIIIVDVVVVVAPAMQRMTCVCWCCCTCGSIIN